MLIRQLTSGGGIGSQPQQTVPAELTEQEKQLTEFVSVVLADTEDVWNTLLQGQYREPTLVLFDGRVASACGLNSSAVGPFYCPPDENVYIDLSGWLPKYFPAALVRAANGPLRRKVLFGSDFPVITPDRWMASFAELDMKPEVRPLVLKANAIDVLGLRD